MTRRALAVSSGENETKHVPRSENMTGMTVKAIRIIESRDRCVDTELKHCTSKNEAKRSD